MVKLEIVSGRNPVKEAMAGNRPVKELYVGDYVESSFQNEMALLAKASDVPMKLVSKTRLHDLAGTAHHQGIVAKVAGFPYCSMADILDRAGQKGEKPFIIILDHLQDPQNFGAILRTADACGAHGVVIPKRRSVDVNETVVKASSGAAEHVLVSKVPNLRQVVMELKKQWIWVIGAELSGQGPFYETDLTVPVALVLGSEGEGLSPLIQRECDILVNIPMGGRVNSLNVSVASALMMYEVYRQRDMAIGS